MERGSRGANQSGIIQKCDETKKGVRGRLRGQEPNETRSKKTSSDEAYRLIGVREGIRKLLL